MAASVEGAVDSAGPVSDGSLEENGANGANGVKGASPPGVGGVSVRTGTADGVSPVSDVGVGAATGGSVSAATGTGSVGSGYNGS